MQFTYLKLRYMILWEFYKHQCTLLFTLLFFLKHIGYITKSSEVHLYQVIHENYLSCLPELWQCSSILWSFQLYPKNIVPEQCMLYIKNCKKFSYHFKQTLKPCLIYFPYSSFSIILQKSIISQWTIVPCIWNLKDNSVLPILVRFL